MATKTKKSTKTSKRPAAKTTHKKTAARTNCKKNCEISSRDRAHVCLVAVLAIVAGILLCADAAIMIVA